MAKNRKFSFVLTDELYKEYDKYTHKGNYDKEIINRLLQFRFSEFLTNAGQVERVLGLEGNKQKIYQLKKKWI